MTRSNDDSAAMRQDLVDWMSCQHGMLELADETFHLALRYLDTFLLRRGASPGFRVADCFFFSFLLSLLRASTPSRVSPL